LSCGSVVACPLLDADRRLGAGAAPVAARWHGNSLVPSHCDISDCAPSQPQKLVSAFLGGDHLGDGRGWTGAVLLLATGPWGRPTPLRSRGGDRRSGLLSGPLHVPARRGTRHQP